MTRRTGSVLAAAIAGMLGLSRTAAADRVPEPPDLEAKREAPPAAETQPEAPPAGVSNPDAKPAEPAKSGCAVDGSAGLWALAPLALGWWTRRRPARP